MPERAEPAIRSALSGNPIAEVRYIDAIAPEVTYFHAEEAMRTLFVNPIHQPLVESLLKR
jgi:hypothetical protein